MLRYSSLSCSCGGLELMVKTMGCATQLAPVHAETWQGLTKAKPCRKNIKGLVLVKELALVDPDDRMEVREQRLRGLPALRADIPMYDLLKVSWWGTPPLLTCLHMAWSKGEPAQWCQRVLHPRTPCVPAAQPCEPHLSLAAYGSTVAHTQGRAQSSSKPTLSTTLTRWMQEPWGWQREASAAASTSLTSPQRWGNDGGKPGQPPAPA